MAITTTAKRIEVKKAGALIIQKRKLLVERSTGKQTFNTLGGKLEVGESFEEALKRELYEETGLIIEPLHMHPFGTFSTLMDDGSDRIIHIATFIISDWVGEPIPSLEVEELVWVDSQTELELSESLREFSIPKLKQLNLID
jgi:8-oxo-dGTP pyrophosphatase MutT (NUDIX family)